MSKFKKITSFGSAVVLGGCAGAMGSQWQWSGIGDPPLIEANAPVRSSPQAELMYHILVGELAGKRDHYDIALEHYLAAAQASSDPQVAERAVSIALFLDDDAALMEAAQRWYVLEPETFQARQSLVLALLRNHRMDEAVEHLDAVRAIGARDGQQGFATVAALLGQIDDKELVFQAMQALRARYPESLFALYYHALAALGVEDYATALEGLNTALKRNPRWAPAHLLRARAMIEKGAIDAALQGLAKAVAELPEDRALRIGYARLLVGGGRLEDARQQFQILAQQDTEDVEPLYALGILATEQGEFDQAVDYFMEVLRRNERVMDTYFELGKVEELREDYQKALEWYRKVDDGERYISAQLRAGMVLARLGDLQAMANHFDDLRQDNPQNALTLYLAESHVLREQGHYQASFDVLSQALQEYPDDHELLYARALTAEKIDRLDILEEDLRTIIELDPEHGHALNALGYTLADRTNRYQEALGYLERAIALLPDDAAVLDSMGWVKYRLGHYKESLDYLRRAYDLNQDPEIAAHLSEVLWVVGQQDKALGIWRDALEENPDSPHLLRLKERFEF